MRLRHHEPPSIRSNALDEAGDVAGLVLTVLHRALLVAEDKRAKQHLPHRIPRKHEAHDPLRSARFGEILDIAFRPDDADELAVSDVDEQSFALCLKLDD